ncbi:MAG: hypothetical protein ABF306_19000 [Nocardioides marinisabuli]|uniref:hypothetical protein n=1 Tax=Nocardioides marinisabuli TaxID=419476 RepID=UPI00321BD128
MKRTPTWRRTAAAAVLPLALTGLAACGGDDEAENAEDTSASAQIEDEADDEADEEAGDLEAGDTVPNQEFVDLMTSSFEDSTTARTTMTSETAGVEVRAEGVVDYTSGTPAVQMTMTSAEMGDEPIEMIMVDNVIYMQVPDLGGKYLSMDLDEPGNPLGPMMTDSMDPSKQAEMMEAGLESVTFVGEEDVDGESMERYTAVVDPSATLRDMEGLEDLPQDMLPEEMSYDVWFDDEGHMRRMVVEMGDLGATDMRMDDWGTEVDIEAPPAKQVTTMKDMMGGSSQMG